MKESIDCIGYLRVSTERQASEEKSSLADQERAINDLAKRLGRSVGKWYRDEGASGATIEKRPAFLDLMSYCRHNRRSLKHAGLVLVLNDSRFGRFPDPDQAAALRFELKQLGWIVRFAEGDDVEDVTFRSMIRALGSAQASEYRRNIQRNARRGALGTAAQGFWAGREPYGYRRRVVYPPQAARTLELGQRKAPNEKVKLTPGPESEVEVVRWAFETYAAGAISLGTLARRLYDKVPSRRWSRRVAQAMLQNPAYAGDVIWGRRPSDSEERRKHVDKPLSECVVVRDAHPALVDRELWDHVQARLRVNKRQTRAATGNYALSGMMICTHCGEAYIGGGGGSGARYGRGPLRFYKCRGGVSYPPRCPGPIGTVTRSIVDSAVVDTVAQFLSHPKQQDAIAAAVRRAIEADANEPQGTRARLEREKKALEAKRDRLVARVADGTVTPHEASGVLEDIRRELDRVRAAIDRSRFLSRRRSTAPEIVKAALALAKDFAAVARATSGAELREILRPWIERLTFDKQTRQLTIMIRKVPAMMKLDISPGRDGQKKVVTKRVSLAQERIGVPIVARGAK